MKSKMICLECDKKFLAHPTMSTECPKCGSTDIYFAVESAVLDVLQAHARLAGRANEMDWKSIHSEFMYSQEARKK